jgi:hypothetical protein
MKIENLLKTKVKWKKHETSSRFFYHKNNDQIFLLRINDFPDEPLYTVISDLEIEDMDDKPTEWELET